MSELILRAPLPGWVDGLDDVPDEVFAARMMGDGLAIDPTGAVLVAPCDGEIIVLPESSHAVTLRAENGAEILVHVGIDTVELKGAGFTALARPGARVRAGEPLIRLDLDLLARRARSLVTPVVVTEPEKFRIVDRHAAGRIGNGDRLMTLRAAAASGSIAAGEGGQTAAGTLTVTLAHGLHARPAALLVQSLKSLRADVHLSLRGRSANARSAVALMSLGARHGDSLTVHASGIDAAVVTATLAQALARAAAAHAPPAVGSARPAARGTVAGEANGIVASRGLALGVVAHITRREPSIEERGAGARQELKRLDHARDRVRGRLLRLATGPDAGAGIAGAHLEILDDPELIATAHAHIAAGGSAAHAWREACRQAADALASLADAHLAARADDLRDLELQVLEVLAGAAAPARTPLPENAVIVARDLLPSQFLSLDASRVAGLCTVGGSATSHVAILAGAMDIPMLTGVDESVLSIASGTRVLLDAEQGRITIDPDDALIADGEARIAAQAREQTRLRTAAALDCRTADGERIEVFANVGSVPEAMAAAAAGAEGCGLLRTEFLFLDRAEPPDIAEQGREYQRIVDAFAGRPVIVRTLDAGNDKAVPFLAIPREDNPALGLRGIRASLWRPEILRAQLAAILAVRPAGICRILLPMVNDAAEIEAVRRMIEESGGASGDGVAIKLGVMVETPVAALNAARLARYADFFSIGTNDLTQYVLAVDRTHGLLGASLDSLHPAVLRLIGAVCEAARTAGRSAAVCGSLASEPAAAPILVGLGVRELSAVPGAIPAVKDAIRRRTLAECRALAEHALELDTPQDVRSLLADLSEAESP